MNEMSEQDPWIEPPTRPFRLLDLPIDIRTLIYEQASISSPIAGIFSLRPRHPLLETCKQVREEAYKIMVTGGRFEISMPDNNFYDLVTTVNKIRQVKSDISVKTRRKPTIEILWQAVPLGPLTIQGLLHWLETCQSINDIEWVYRIFQRHEDRLNYRSRTDFLWRMGVPVLRCLRDRLSNTCELDLIIAGYETEGDLVDDVANHTTA